MARYELPQWLITRYRETTAWTCRNGPSSTSAYRPTNRASSTRNAPDAELQGWEVVNELSRRRHQRREGASRRPYFVASFSGKGTVSAYSAAVVFHDIRIVAHRKARSGKALRGKVLTAISPHVPRCGKRYRTRSCQPPQQNRQQDVERGLRAAEAVLPGLEIGGRPIAQGRLIIDFRRCVVGAPDAR